MPQEAIMETFDSRLKLNNLSLLMHLKIYDVMSYKVGLHTSATSEPRAKSCTKPINVRPAFLLCL